MNEVPAVSALQGAIQAKRQIKMTTKMEASIRSMSNGSPELSTGSSDSSSKIDTLVNFHASVLTLRMEQANTPV